MTKSVNVSKLTDIVKTATAALTRAKAASDALNAGAGDLVDNIARVEQITANVADANKQLTDALAAISAEEVTATGPAASPSTPSPSPQAPTPAALPGNKVGDVPGAAGGVPGSEAFSPGASPGTPPTINTGTVAGDVKAAQVQVAAQSHS